MEKNLQKVYRNNVFLFFLWFFIFLNVFLGALITVSVRNGEGAIIVPILIFSVTLVLLILSLYIVYKIKVCLFEDKIIIYGKRLNGISLVTAFTTGYTISYVDLLSMDLIPVKFFNRVLTYQICFRLKNVSSTLYLNNISNLDVLFINIRTLRFKKKKEN